MQLLCPHTPENVAKMANGTRIQKIGTSFQGLLERQKRHFAVEGHSSGDTAVH
jgi:hypothetical protein